MQTQPEQEGDREGRITRRDALKSLAAIGLGAAAGCASHPRQSPGVDPAGNPVRRENARHGTREWMLTRTGIDPKTKYRCPWIEGYCSHTSIKAGETIRFFVSTNPASAFRIDIYRMGFYGGAGGRQVASLGSFPGKVQPEPPVGELRVRDCEWEASAELTIPADWLSGVYLGKLTAEREGWQSYVIFIVRDDRPTDFIFQCSDTTWQAYNRWPSQFSLYDDGRNVWHCGPGSAVSFNRPYGKYCQILDAPLSTGSGEFFLWEFPFAYWLEANGYDVTYLSNLDTHRGAALTRARGFLSVGHDEYYTLEMYQQLLAAIGRGLSVGFFSGNTCCGRIELSPDRNGMPNRIFTRADYFGPRALATTPAMSSATTIPISASHLPPCVPLLSLIWRIAITPHTIAAAATSRKMLPMNANAVASPRTAVVTASVLIAT
jgi:hypothetical protein